MNPTENVVKNPGNSNFKRFSGAPQNSVLGGHHTTTKVLKHNPSSPICLNKRLKILYSSLFHSKFRTTTSVGSSTVKWELLTESDYSSGDDREYNENENEPPRFKSKQRKFNSKWNPAPPKFKIEHEVPPKFKQEHDPPLRSNKIQSLTTPVPLPVFDHKSTSSHNHFGSTDSWKRLEVISDDAAPAIPAILGATAIDPNAPAGVVRGSGGASSKSIGKIPLDEISSSASSLPGTKDAGEAKPRKGRKLIPKPLKGLRKSGKAVKAFGKTLKTGFLAMGKNTNIALSVSPQLYDYTATTTDYSQETQYYHTKSRH